MRQGIRIVASCIFLVIWCETVIAQHMPSTAELTKFYQAQLRSQSQEDRMDGITGLAHLGSDASQAVPALIKLSKVEPDNFNRLLCLWALAEIGTYEAFEWSRSQALKEKPKLREGSFKEVSARTVLLSTVEQGENIFRLNKMLLRFYNKARNGNIPEQLTAQWALFELSTSASINTAERTIQPLAQNISPDQSNFVQNLRLIRLVGPLVEDFFKDQLSALIENHDFSLNQSTKRAQTAYTLARTSYPNENKVVEKVANHIAERLNKQSTRRAALKDAVALGPFICGSEIIGTLSKISKGKANEPEKKLANNLISKCTE